MLVHSLKHELHVPEVRVLVTQFWLVQSSLSDQLGPLVVLEPPMCGLWRQL